MKRVALIIALVLALSTAAMAEATPAPTSSTDEFLSNLSKTWDSILKMTNEAGQNISDWADKSGVSAWAQGAINDVTAWLNGSGLVEWSQYTLTQLNTWMEQSGINAWTEELASQFQTFIDQNGPAIEAWLQQAGKDISDAWNMLANPEGHTAEELQQAYQTVTDALTEAGKPTEKPQQ